jgi:hypothetical protein
MKQDFLNILSFILGLILGLAVISLLAEGIEFGLVTLVNGGITSDQDVYFEIRNRPWFLFLKFIYNGLALYAGGWLAAKIALRWKLTCVVTLAIVQLVSFFWGMTLSEFAGTTPFWAWTLLSIEIPFLVFRGGRNAARTALR